MIHNDGTMDVEINGQIERREYVVSVYRHSLTLTGERCEPASYKPELFEGEILVERIGLPPLIVRTEAMIPDDDICTNYHCPGDCGKRGAGYQHRSTTLRDPDREDFYSDLGGNWVSGEGDEP